MYGGQQQGYQGPYQQQPQPGQYQQQPQPGPYQQQQQPGPYQQQPGPYQQQQQQQQQQLGGGAYQVPTMGGYQQPSALKQWFDAVDQDRSGKINPKELQAALSTGGYSFNISTAERMLRMFDRDQSGSIGFPEFQQLHMFINTMTQGFKSRDRSGDGSLDGREVRSALQEGGYQVQEGTFQILMRKFDRDQRGSLKFDDYVELSIFISTVRNTFDLNRSGTVTFDNFLKILTML